MFPLLRVAVAEEDQGQWWFSTKFAFRRNNLGAASSLSGSRAGSPRYFFIIIEAQAILPSAIFMSSTMYILPSAPIIIMTQ